MTGDPRVVIVGGGPGGLEAALALRALARDRVEITLVSAGKTFPYRPWSVAEPFGVGRAVDVDLERLAELEALEFVVARANGIDAGHRVVLTDAGAIPYDVLILALGARQVPTVAGALAFRGPRDVGALREALERDATAGARVAYVANASAFWTLPAYELALLTQTWGDRRDTPLHVAVVTAESAPLEAFGADASRQVAELLSARGVLVHMDSVVDMHDAGRLYEAGAPSIPADLAIALPTLVGPALDGLPHDDAGFVDVDDYGRVRGVDGVFAIGDMTNRALKQGGLATQQADVVAAVIASEAGAVCETRPYEPVLRAVLMTGDRPLYLRNPTAMGDRRADDSVFGAPWWPPHKIAGLHLAPYLAVHADLLTPISTHG